MKNPVYRIAAEFMARNETTFSCITVAYSSSRDNRVENVKAYEELFFPPAKLNRTSKYHSRYELGDAWGDLWGNTDEERHNCRVLALLFMHEIANS